MALYSLIWPQWLECPRRVASARSRLMRAMWAAHHRDVRWRLVLPRASYPSTFVIGRSPALHEPPRPSTPFADEALTLGTQPVRCVPSAHTGKGGVRGATWSIWKGGPLLGSGRGHVGSDTVAGRPPSFRSDDVDAFASRRWYPGPTGVRGGSRHGLADGSGRSTGSRLCRRERSRYEARGCVGEGGTGVMAVEHGRPATPSWCPWGGGTRPRTSTPHSRRRHEQTCERSPLDGG
jgi:hypothetical protein